MTSNGFTLTKCLPENTGLVLSEIFKDPPIVPYKRGPKRLLHVNGSRAGLSPYCYPLVILTIGSYCTDLAI